MRKTIANTEKENLVQRTKIVSGKCFLLGIPQFLLFSGSNSAKCEETRDFLLKKATVHVFWDLLSVAEMRQKEGSDEKTPEKKFLN